jgi:hypothetical protein
MLLTLTLTPMLQRVRNALSVAHPIDGGAARSGAELAAVRLFCTKRSNDICPTASMLCSSFTGLID